MKTQPLEILLVEDNPYDAELALADFKALNLTNAVVHLADGQSALDFFFAAVGAAGRPAARTPRLVFLDLELPKVDGLTVLARLKSDRRTRDVPVVVLTGSGEEAALLRTYELGADDFLVKPLTVEKLMSAVARLGLSCVLLGPPATVRHPLAPGHHADETHAERVTHHP
jgi:CheY-like chemotaxis protein